MSDRIDLLPIAVWSTCVAVQTGTAIYGWWKNRAEIEEGRLRTQIENVVASSGFGKIVRGRVINSWKPWISSSVMVDGARVVPPPWPKETERTDRTITDGFTTLLLLKARSPSVESGRMWCLRRQSLLATNVYSDIAQITYNESSWEMAIAGHISERIVAVVFERKGTNQVRVFLLDVVLKALQQFEVTSPQRGAETRLIFRDEIANDRIMILFKTWVGHVPGFNLVEYEVRPTEAVAYPFVRRMTSRRLDTFMDIWDFYTNFAAWNFPTKYYFMQNEVTEAVHVVSVDREGIHDLGDSTPWLAQFTATPFGQRATKAIESFKSLIPSDPSFRMSEWALVELTRSNLFGKILWFAPCDIIQHPLLPPSLKKIAAESFYRGNQSIDFSVLKNAIGFDIFDGIYDGKPTRVIL